MIHLLRSSAKTILMSLFASYPVWDSVALASNSDKNGAITIAISQINGGFEVHASYLAPLSQCQAYALLTDFSESEQSEGIRASKITRLSENRIRVEQQIEDKILFFSTQFESVIDYTQLPSYGIDLKQVKGYFKEYRGSWRLTPKSNGTLFSYTAFILPDQAIPLFVIEYFMNARIEKRFEKMLQKATSKAGFIPEQCK